MICSEYPSVVDYGGQRWHELLGTPEENLRYLRSLPWAFAATWPGLPSGVLDWCLHNTNLTIRKFEVNDDIFG